MKRKKALGLFIICLSFGITYTLWARPVKVGVVDIQRVLRDSQVVREDREAFLQNIKTKSIFLENRGKELLKREEEIRKLPARTPPKERQEQLDKLKNDVRELKYLREDLEEELKRKEAEIGGKHIREILQLIRNYARDEGYTTIIDRGAVIAADEDLDITATIIKLYDNKKKK